MMRLDPTSSKGMIRAIVPGVSVEERSVQCPACEDQLAPTEYGGLAVTRCASCGGSWLTGGAFGSLLQMDGSGFSPRDVAKLKVLTEYRVTKTIQATEHPCPRCGKKLKARNYASIAGFFVEQCPGGCGVWVREGDMDRIRILRSLGVTEEVKTRPRGPAKPPAAAPARAAGGEASGKPAPGPEAPASADSEEPGPVRGTVADKPPGRTTKRSPRAATPDESTKESDATRAAAAPRRGFLARLLGRLFGRR